MKKIIQYGLILWGFGFVLLSASAVFSGRDIASAYAEERRALTPGKVEAQEIENQNSKQKAENAAALWAGMKPVLIQSGRGLVGIGAVVLIVLGGYAAFSVSKSIRTHNSRPTIQFFGDGMALATTASGDMRIINIQTNMVVSLTDDTAADEMATRLHTTIALAQQQSQQTLHGGYTNGLERVS